jgi:hypothetical protein
LVPDLTTQSARIPSTVSAGLDLAALLNLANVGGKPTAAETRGHVWFSDNNIAGDSDDFDSGIDFFVPQLAGNASVDQIVHVPLPEADPFGTDGAYHLVFVVDSTNLSTPANHLTTSFTQGSASI